MFAVYQKELKAYFRSFFGWLFLAAFSFFGAIYFFANNVNYGYPYFSSTLQSLITILLFVLPLLTMRIFAEEKKLKTDQMLLTYPINLWSVCLGKFFALCTIVLFALVIIATGALIMSFFGSVPLADTLLSMLGFFLFACVCISVGMFLSALTEYQVIAAIFTYAFFIFEMIVPSVAGIFFNADHIVTKIISVIDIMAPFDTMFASMLNLNDILYVISVIIIFLLLTYKVFGKNTVQLNAVGRNSFFGNIILTVLIIAAIVGINVGAKFIPDKYVNYDFTHEGWYSITQDTKDVIAGLDEDITIYVIGDENSIDPVLKLYLDAYQSKHINIEYRPTDVYPGFGNEYTDYDLEVSSMIVVKGERSNVITAGSLYEQTYSFESYDYETTGIDMEGQITAAISNLINDNIDVIYVTSGHGETTLYSGIENQIIKGGYEIEDLVMLNYTSIPEDCACLIINGPSSDLNADEVTMIESYYNKGGKIIMAASLDVEETPRYDALMEKLTGMTLSEGSVLESSYDNMYQYIPYIIMMRPTYTPITSNVYNEGKRCIFYTSRGFTDSEDDSSVYIEKLFTTSEQAYSKVLVDETAVNYAQGDEQGTFALGVYGEKTIDDNTEAKVLALGSPYFLEESTDEESSKANSGIVIGAINEFCDKELVSTIPAKSVNYETITLPFAVRIVYFVVFVLLLPLCFIVTGIALMIIRRKK